MHDQASALPGGGATSTVRIPYFLSEGSVMLAKLTSKNQLTLPKAVVEEIGAAEYFDVAVDAGRIVLTPVKIQRADAVREKLAQLRLTESDVSAAVGWARRRKSRKDCGRSAGSRRSRLRGDA